jgi:cytochrome oxidase Cu insertion factor (SCO1/SenC/PrrC family)
MVISSHQLSGGYPMIRRALAVGLAALLAVVIPAAWAQQAPANQTSTLKAGDTAPDFSLADQNGNTVRLSDFRGKQNVVLAFFVLAFTGG